jgi:serine/threonine protein kinase
MEFADGGDLKNYLKETFDMLTWDDKFNLALQLAYAISCLHDEGIVHRDLVIHTNILFRCIVNILDSIK